MGEHTCNQGMITGRQRQEDCKCNASGSYKGRPCLKTTHTHTTTNNSPEGWENLLSNQDTNLASLELLTLPGSGSQTKVGHKPSFAGSQVRPHVLAYPPICLPSSQWLAWGKGSQSPSSRCGPVSRPAVALQGGLGGRGCLGWRVPHNEVLSLWGRFSELPLLGI